MIAIARGLPRKTDSESKSKRTAKGSEISVFLESLLLWLSSSASGIVTKHEHEQIDSCVKSSVVVESCVASVRVYSLGSSCS